MIDNKDRNYPHPFSLRLTFEERTNLEMEAGNQPLGAYIRDKALSKKGGCYKRKKHRKPVRDEQALVELLGTLGKSNISNNLNQLAKAAHTGSLPVTPDVEHQLDNACADIHWMREKLVQALGLKL